MRFPRASGVLLHPTSLPSKFGIGDLGPAACRFVDWLANAGQTYWQILPLNLTGWGGSPYSTVSAFAGNILLISPEKLVEHGLIDASVMDSAPELDNDKVDFGAVEDWKRGILAQAFETFRGGNDASLRDGFAAFVRENGWWLDDLALFIALKNSNGHAPWYEWTEPLRTRDRDAIERARSQLSRKIESHKFSQFLFHRQWLALKKYANERSVLIIGDIPIFVAHDSADVWCNQQLFKLNEDGSPKVVAGVPPDYFSSTGQLWGNPIYDWQAMKADDFGWWTARLAFTLKTVDIVRLDHFIGFAHNWEVPASEKTAVDGRWIDVPGEDIFATLKKRLGDLPVIVEDLGAVTPTAEKLRDSCGFPGMRILQYAFGGDAYSRDLPHNYIQNCVAYAGTHDNDTCRGWFKNIPKNVRDHCRTYLGSTGRDISWDMIRAVWSSVANTAVAQLQDVLTLGSEARMNTPATGEGNWQWRFRDGDLTDELAARLREMTELFGRVDGKR